jgi:DNA-binding NarL/FixJ family response regulator
MTLHSLTGQVNAVKHQEIEMRMIDGELRSLGNDSHVVEQMRAASWDRAEDTTANETEGGDPAIVVIDRRVLFRECLVRCLNDTNKADRILSFSSVDEWLEIRPAATPGLVIVLCSAERNEPEVESDIASLLRNIANLSIILLSDREDAGSVLSALNMGARGFIPTSTAFDVADQAIRLVRAGGTFVPAHTLIASNNSIEKLPLNSENARTGLFTARQLTVVEALRQGKSNKIIAYELNMCESTVKVHVRNIMKKIGAKNRTEVAFRMNGMEANTYRSNLDRSNLESARHTSKTSRELLSRDLETV